MFAQPAAVLVPEKLLLPGSIILLRDIPEVQITPWEKEGNRTQVCLPTIVRNLRGLCLKAHPSVVPAVRTRHSVAAGSPANLP